jgi:hypothetical protein
MASTPTDGNATTKKRKIKKLPDGISQLTESNFRTAMEFRLETDSHETGEVMVAYRAKMANVCFSPQIEPSAIADGAQISLSSTDPHHPCHQQY